MKCTKITLTLDGVTQHTADYNSLTFIYITNFI